MLEHSPAWSWHRAGTGVPFHFCTRKAYTRGRGRWLLLVFSLLVQSLNALQAATFAASCQPDPLWHLLDNQYNFTSDKQRDKRREMQRTQNKRLQVSLSKQASTVQNYFSVCTDMLVDLFTVFAYFQIAGGIGLGFPCLLG